MLLLPAIAGGAYLLVGRQAFRAARERPYELGLTGLIVSFGVLLVGTA